MTVTYIFGLLLPLVIAFYLLLSTLEDSGYLPRIAALSDRLMTTIGLNGRAIIPMILGFGCITMATITTRILGNERERRIATALMAFAIPCSAQLGVIIALLAAAGGGAVALAYVGIMVLVFGLVGLAMAQLPAGQVDRPAYRPAAAAPAAADERAHQDLPQDPDVPAGGEPLLRRRAPCCSASSRLTGALAGPAGAPDAAHRRLAAACPREAATAFVMGFVRRDFGAAGLYDLRSRTHADPGRARDHHPVRALHRLGAGHHEGARQGASPPSPGWAASGWRSSVGGIVAQIAGRCEGGEGAGPSGRGPRMPDVRAVRPRAGVVCAALPALP